MSGVLCRASSVGRAVFGVLCRACSVARAVDGDSARVTCFVRNINCSAAEDQGLGKQCMHHVAWPGAREQCTGVCVAWCKRAMHWSMRCLV